MLVSLSDSCHQVNQPLTPTSVQYGYNYTMRFAIWAAVSTEQQAESDKASLPVQEETCKRAADLKGWTDTGLRFIVPGESRTRWMDLSTAASHIPALRQLISCAENNKFDILVLYDFNRLRDLLQPASMFLGSFGIPLYSISQPVEPETKDSDAHIIVETISGMMSRLQISDLKRKYAMAMPRRIADRGLPHRIPYGYHKPFEQETNPNAVPIQDSHAAILVEIKDRYLAGQSLPQIADWLEEIGEPAPKGGKYWYPATIWNMLRNPFYAGIVRFGASKNRRNMLTGKYERSWHVPESEIIKGIGKHKPLWDEATYRQIMDETVRRGRKYAGRRTSILAGLLFCGACGRIMWIWGRGGKSTGEDYIRVYRCSSRRNHPHIYHEEAIRKLGRLLSEMIRHYPVDPPPPPPDMVDRQAQIDDLKARLDRLKEGYLSGIFDKIEYSNRAQKFLDRIGKLQLEIESGEDKQKKRQVRLDILGNLADMGDRVADTMLNGDWQKYNRLLHLVIKRITLMGDGTLKVELR